MKPHISVITLGVNDLEKSLTFYRDGLGLHTHGIIGTEFTGDETHPSGAAVMFELQNGFITKKKSMHFLSRQKLLVLL